MRLVVGEGVRYRTTGECKRFTTVTGDADAIIQIITAPTAVPEQCLVVAPTEVHVSTTGCSTLHGSRH